MKNNYLRCVIRHFLIWTPAFAFWTMMRQFGQEVVLGHEPFTFMEHVRMHASLGVVGGIIFGSLDYSFARWVVRKVSFGRALLIGSVSYLVAIIILVTFGMRIFTRIMQQEMNWEIYHNFIFSNEMLLLIFYCFLVGFMIDFMSEIDKRLGPGNLWKMIKGEFYSPKEDERIFMFLDLKSSTAIAEQLGHIQYSRMIQDCFQDLDVMTKYHAEIYQYVGDEAVLTWPREIGLADSNCLRAFFDFKSLLESKADYYKSKYGLVPEFKAGLNVGKIVVAEVGNVKSEIAYHGDTINTAARIQGECNRLHVDILISENLRQSLNPEPTVKSELKDQIQLRGKQEAINLYAVELIKAG